MATVTATMFNPHLVQLVALQDRIDEMRIELENIGDELGSLVNSLWPDKVEVTEETMSALQAEVNSLRAA